MATNPFNDFIESIVHNHGEENWVTVYKNLPIAEKGDEDGGMYCALVEFDQTEHALGQFSWDIRVAAGRPGFCVTYEDGEEITSYHTNPDERYKRIVLVRDFAGLKDNYVEILEEFRLFHNLYYDKKMSVYLAFDENGDEVEVIRVNQSEVKIRRSFLKSFMAAIQMNLLLYFELTRHFKFVENFSTERKDSSLVFTCYSGDSYLQGYTSFSRILGKKLIRCGPMESCGIWPFEKKKSYQDFAIAGDEDNLVEFTCNPDLLANYFGANPESPHYLTPVFFRKEVMQKYYGASDYEITDGHLHRRGAWSLRVDNNSSMHVCVFLGDLGTDLPEREQIYWKSFNVVPNGRNISLTNFRRSFLGRFSDPENPEHAFKYEFKRLQDAWHKKYGWTIFLPLAKRDEHYLNSIRSMLSNEQSEFDSQILALAKVTIDSINVKEVRGLLGLPDPERLSIALIESLMKKLQINNTLLYADLLRGIQSVRSTGVAHRKGAEYQKVIKRLNIDESDYQTEFDQILLRMIDFLRAMNPEG